MKMPNRKIEKCVSKNDARYYLENPYLDTESSVIVSTNGHIMAVCPVELDKEDTSGSISTESLKAALKACTERTIKNKTANIKANGSLVLDNGQVFPRIELTQKWVDYKRVIPDASKAEIVIGLDAKLLKDLADAICEPGNSQIRLKITDHNTAIYVDSKGSDCYGVIMPVRID